MSTERRRLPAEGNDGTLAAIDACGFALVGIGRISYLLNEV